MPSMENVAMSVTWSTAWRGTLAQVSVTRYQPAARRLGSWIHEKPSSTVWTLRLALTTRVSPASGPGGGRDARPFRRVLDRLPGVHRGGEASSDDGR